MILRKNLELNKLIVKNLQKILVIKISFNRKRFIDFVHPLFAIAVIVLLYFDFLLYLLYACSRNKTN